MTPLEACAFPVFSLALLKLSDQGGVRVQRTPCNVILRE
jgi:hypothetical protein